MNELAIAKIDKAVSAAQRRAERIRVGMHSFIATRREIADAYKDRDWVTLGYASFEEYVDYEFSETRLRLSPEERREAVAELRLTGMSQRAIGAVLGVSQPTVRRDLDATESNDSVPDRITGTDGREQPASRPKTPGPVDAAIETPPADPGVIPAPAVQPSAGAGPAPVPAADAPVPSQEPGRHLHSVPSPAGSKPTGDADLEARLAADSARRAAVRNLTSVLTFLNPVSIHPVQLAKQEYAPVLDAFDQEDLDRAAQTMTAIAAMKRGM